jgi:hypothetical protein
LDTLHKTRRTYNNNLVINTQKYKENKGGINQTQLIDGIDYCLVPGNPKYHIGGNERIQTQQSANKERRSTTAPQPYSTSEAPKKPRNHISRDTFTNVTKSEKRGKHGKGTGKRILGGTRLKDRTRKVRHQDQQDKKPTLQEAFQQRGTIHNHLLTTTRGASKMAEAGVIVSTTLLEVPLFSGDKETREHDGRKHIRAADVLRETARRKAANPAWNDKAAIGHYLRSIRNDVAVWWKEAIPSDKCPKMLKVITTRWKEFEMVFRRAWKIKATMTSVSWMKNNRQKPNLSIAAFVTCVQNAVATTSREALTNKANDAKEKDELKWNDHTEKYLAAQAVYNARALATPWTAAEKEAIKARNKEYGHEQQEAAR